MASRDKILRRRARYRANLRNRGELALPLHWSNLAPEIDDFKTWLERHHVRIDRPWNALEVLRFRTSRRASVVFRRLDQTLVWIGESIQAFYAWKLGRPFSGGPWPDTSDLANVDPIVRDLLARDGGECFYCLDPMKPWEATIEHLVARVHDGPNHKSNYVLSHQSCNVSASVRSVSDKVKIREAALMERARALARKRPDGAE